MASNGHHHGGRTVLVLYKVVNSVSDNEDPCFNAFHMPFGNGPTLAAVKQNCAAAHSLSHLGPEGYHWRVLVEDKPSSPGCERTFSWWDIQDSNAKLPVKETTQYELRKLLAPPKPTTSTTDSATKAAKGAFKMMGKAMASVAGEDITDDQGPPISVLTFKLLDLVKIHDNLVPKGGSGSGGGRSHQPSSVGAPRTSARPAPAPTSAPPPRMQKQQQQRPQQPPQQQQQHQQQYHHHQQRPGQPGPPPPGRPRAQQQQHQPPSRPHQVPGRQAAPQTAPVPSRPVPDAPLMDFGDSPAKVHKSARVLHHTTSSPAAFGGFGSAAVPNPNESRAERLKREYAKKKATSNRVWDDVDQRWVEVDSANGSATSSAGVGINMNGMDGPPKKKEVGISLDPSNAAGKSASVQAAVHKRVADMQKSQNKALQEVREREQKKKADEEAEDEVRKRLEPKIKTWSEEHGKKKQLRALLASLHTILWQGAKWKQLSIGDILDDSKVKRAFHKATLVVHPDKTHHLDAEKRFLAKRIFDALSQAKTEFDNGAR